MASWKETSKAGFEFEDFCLKDINEKKNPLAYKNMIKENYSFYDIILHDGNFSNEHNQKTAECKFDEMAAITGNICIETGCNGRLSGLLITKATYWIIGDGVTMYLTTPAEIRRCLTENPNIDYRKNQKVPQKKGENKLMDMYLIPKRIFENYCLEISGMDNMTYEKI
jgi:hypothetical protein